MLRSALSGSALSAGGDSLAKTTGCDRHSDARTTSQSPIEAPRVTLKVQRLSQEPAPSPMAQAPSPPLGGGGGGALLGQLGSAVVSRMLGGGNTGGAAIPHHATTCRAPGRIDALLVNHDAGAALVLIDDGGALSQQPQLTGLRRRADDELKNRFRYQAFEQLASPNWLWRRDCALRRISPDSSYRHRASRELRPCAPLHRPSSWRPAAKPKFSQSRRPP